MCSFVFLIGSLPCVILVIQCPSRVRVVVASIYGMNSIHDCFSLAASGMATLNI